MFDDSISANWNNTFEYVSYTSTICIPTWALGEWWFWSLTFMKELDDRIHDLVRWRKRELKNEMFSWYEDWRVIEITERESFRYHVYRHLAMASDNRMMPFKWDCESVPISKFEYLRSTVEYKLPKRWIEVRETSTNHCFLSSDIQKGTTTLIYWNTQQSTPEDQRTWCNLEENLLLARKGIVLLHMQYVHYTYSLVAKSFTYKTNKMYHHFSYKLGTYESQNITF